MGKIRSSEELDTLIDEEIAFRKHEISQLRSLLNSKKDSNESRVLAKALIVISYSHWEGFVKIVSRKYLEYIKFLGYNSSTLNERLISSILFNNLCKSSTNTLDKIDHIHSLLTQPGFKPDIDCLSLSDTKSNLNSEVFETIVANIGLDTTAFKSKYPYLDGTILKNRNDFAHGDNKWVDINTSIDISNTVVELIESFKTLVQNAIVLKTYKKAP